MITVHAILAKIYQKRGDHKLAFEQLQNVGNLKDSVLTVESSRQLTEMQTLYETEKKERKIQLLEKDQLIQEEQLKTERNRKNFLLTGLISVFIIAGLFLNFQRLKIQKNRQLRERDQQLHAHKQELIQLDLIASQKELAYKEDKLQAFTEQLVQKNHLLKEVEQELTHIHAVNESEEKARLQKITDLQQARILTSEDWQSFQSLFEEVYATFFTKLKEAYPQLSKADHRLLALMKLRMDNDRIADMLAISYDSLKKSRYRLRKKLDLSKAERLTVFVEQIA